MNPTSLATKYATLMHVKIPKEIKQSILLIDCFHWRERLPTKIAFRTLKSTSGQNWILSWWNSLVSDFLPYMKILISGISKRRRSLVRSRSKWNSSRLPKYLVTSFVVQKYLEDPYLYNTRKFDLRVYIFISHEMKCFLFPYAILNWREYLARLSSDSFALSNPNPFVHLTNNAVQQHGNGFGRFEEGNMMTFTNLFMKSTINDRQTIDDQIEEVSKRVFAASKGSLNPSNHKHCFELFGLDIIIDSNLKCWLLEVNSNPSLECANKEVSTIKHRLVGSLFSSRRYVQADHRQNIRGAKSVQQIRTYLQSRTDQQGQV